MTREEAKEILIKYELCKNCSQEECDAHSDCESCPYNYSLSDAREAKMILNTAIYTEKHYEKCYNVWWVCDMCGEYNIPQSKYCCGCGKQLYPLINEKGLYI